jgi:putative ABC transport system substrate-binding protein
MRRRDIIGMVLVSATIAPLAAARAQPRVARLGILLFGSPLSDPSVEAFRAGLGELNYIEGRNILFEFGSAEGDAGRLPALAAKLVALGPDVLVAFGGDVAPAARNASATIPIAALTSGDPVRGGLVESLARPGGNLTGVTLLATDLAAKRIELLVEAVPGVRRIGFLWNPDHADDDLRETQLAAAALELQLMPLPIRRRDEVEPALQTAAGSVGADALVVVSSRLTALTAKQIVEFAAEHRLPLICGWGPWVKRGALMAYGPDPDESARRLAGYVDKLLRGAKPADLPIEQPARFELGINLKTARALGLTIAPPILARADTVIE